MLLPASSKDRWDTNLAFTPRLQAHVTLFENTVILKEGIVSSTEDFSYFTLRREATSTQNATSLFGISCTRQIPASSLIVRSPDVTRSTVQKAVVVVTDGPQHFGPLREKLSMVTSAWFAQRYPLHAVVEGCISYLGMNC